MVLLGQEENIYKEMKRMGSKFVRLCWSALEGRDVGGKVDRRTVWSLNWMQAAKYHVLCSVPVKKDFLGLVTE